MSNFRERKWLLLLLIALAAGCAFPGQPKLADRPVPADEVMDFDILYKRNCAACHGTDGTLGPAPPLNDPIFRAIVSEADLVEVITNGRAVTPTQKTPMPAFGPPKRGSLTTVQQEVLAELEKQTHVVPRQTSPLTTDQIKVLAEGIKHWGPAASVPRDFTESGAGSGDKEEGLRVFRRACADCHGSQGQGGDAGALNDRAFLALISDHELRRLAITGRPDLGMPPYDGAKGRNPDFKPLTTKEIDHLVALLADWRRGGSNKTKPTPSEK
jgi:mono/diheme cytochrome c family protein